MNTQISRWKILKYLDINLLKNMIFKALIIGTLT